MTREANGAFVWPIRVYYEDTDAQGIVYYANYLKFIERARTEMFRKLDMSPTKIQHEFGTLIVVRRCDLVFRQPAKLEDELDVYTKLISAEGVRIRLEQNVMKADTLLVSADVELALINTQGRPRRIPGELKDLLTRISETS